MEVNVTTDSESILDQMTVTEIIDYIVRNHSHEDMLKEIDEADAIKYYDIEVANN